MDIHKKQLRRGCANKPVWDKPEVCKKRGAALFLFISFLVCVPELLMASGGAVNYFATIEHAIGGGEPTRLMLSSLLTLLITIVLGSWYSKAARQGEVKPSGFVNLRFFVESALDVVFHIAESQCGKDYKKYLTPLSAIFFFVLITNLMGLVPGFPPATENFSANLAIGLFAFIVYNVAGIKEHGIGYVKQFWGPVMAIGPLFLCLEIMSHMGRPLSLGLRLTANVFGDHLLVGVFSQLVPVGVPAVLMLFGLLVACVQSFIFALMTAIYINLAISHDH
ncbi:MAG: F0F1 ATP synthase subunit A [Oligoflexales bacterium]